MWFNPSLEITTDPVANLANSANYQPDLKEISKISGISNQVVIENEITNPLELAELAELATHPVVKTNVACGQCLHFKSHHSHGKGAGGCLVGGAYGSWSETQHQCSKFDAAVEWVELLDPKPNAIEVIVYTPNGNAIEIEARDEAHALRLQQMNPKPPKGILK